MENPNHTKTQVVIIGAGPTGLSMAAQLIRHKIDFIIIEKNDKTTNLSKAIAVQARTLEIFQELGIVEEAMKRGQLTTGMILFSKGKRRASLDLSNMGKGLSDFPFALSLEQSKTEQLLAEYLQKNGKQIKWNAELNHFEQDNNGVKVYYKDKNGTEQKIEADYLVGCDGAGSLVRHQLGLSFEGSTEPKLFYVADVILKSSVINENRLYMYLIPKGFVLFFPMEGTGHYRIIGVLPEHTDDSHEYNFAEVEPIIKKGIISPVDFGKVQWFSTYKVHSRKANSFMDGRCFIAGDAAHIHTPAGGQGMNTGIQDAYNLAWKMVYSLRGEVNNKVLQSYNTERTQNAKNLLNTTDRMFDIMSGVNGFWNFIRNGFFPIFLMVLSSNNFVKRKIYPLLSQIGIAYPDSFLTSKSSIGKAKAGDRMHYFVFSDGKSIFSYLAEPVFKLLYFGKNTIQNPLDNTGIAMSFHSFTEIPDSVFDNNTDFYVLVRPDNHISYIGKDVAECRSFISKIKASAKN
ncbi:MAG: FAD-dependent monooxygenase [Flavobacterium sp.]|uniref:FAD-dependent monooxygenase n=1 Tax=Flavobacterium sp. TaxID=239 RepID=UPI0032677B5D